MPREVWKEYEANLLTHSAAHYLMTIHELLDRQGYARVTDIAHEMGITRGSCSISLKPLKRRELVVEDENKHIQLSERGRMLAELVSRNDELLEAFFCEVLGVEAEQAEVDACKIEHLVSIDTSVKLAHFIELMRSGSPVVQQFLEELRGTEQPCNHNVEECEFCQSVCIEDARKPATEKNPA